MWLRRCQPFVSTFPNIIRILMDRCVLFFFSSIRTKTIETHTHTNRSWISEVCSMWWLFSVSRRVEWFLEPGYWLWQSARFYDVSFDFKSNISTRIPCTRIPCTSIEHRSSNNVVPSACPLYYPMKWNTNDGTMFEHTFLIDFHKTIRFSYPFFCIVIWLHSSVSHDVNSFGDGLIHNHHRSNLKYTWNLNYGKCECLPF